MAPLGTSRRLLLISLLTASTALSGTARADTGAGGQSWPEVGGWGQAWGSDDPAAARPAPTIRRPASAPPAGYTPPPAAAALPERPTIETAPPAAASPLPQSEMGAVYPETGSWGQAWGDEEPVRPAPPRSRTLPPTLSNAAPPPVEAPAPSVAPQAPPRPTTAGPAKPAVGLEEEAEDLPNAGPAARAQALSRTPSRVSPVMRGPDESGDAVGLRRPPRVIPRAMRSKENGTVEAVHMTADQVIYDREFNVVTAKGRVEMMYEGRTITADSVSYNMKQDVMGASGNVVLTEPSGDVTHADYFELTGDFKNGVARDIRAILADNSRVAAQSAQRVGGDRTDLDRAVYTACEPCKDNPDSTPLWQVKAERVTHNQAEAQVEYRDAWLELWGIPVAYTPYLSHPDPTIKRRSGFLAPTIGMNSSLGASVSTPWFQVMSDQEDFTLTPRFMLDKLTNFSTPDKDVGASILKRVQISGEHRWRGMHGESLTKASIAGDKTTGDVRGHIEAKGLVELDSTWRAGWQVQHESDRAYRNLYKIRTDADRPWLMTRPYVEGFSRRGYAMMEAMMFEGDRVVSDGTKAPVVLPHMFYSTVSAPGWAGSYWTSDSDLLAYARDAGAQARRVSSRIAWNLPLTTPDGQVMTLTTAMRGDGYNTDQVTGAAKSSGNYGRALPEASLNWRYPFTRPGRSLTQVIEPMAMAAISPIGGNDPGIPNEDGLGFELDETNVMRPNRLPGLDRVEGGARGAYGLRWAAYPARGGAVAVQAAQGWRSHKDKNTFAPGSGFTETLSDYVARVDVMPIGNLNLHDRVRLDKNTLEVRRNEAGVRVGPPALNVGIDYGLLSPSTVSAAYSERQYINYSAASQMSRHWKSTVSLQQDLADNGAAVTWSANTQYSDECFSIIGAFNRYNTTVPGLMSGYHLSLTLVLKSLGEAPITVF